MTRLHPLLLLVLEIILPRNQHRLIPGVAALGLLGTLIGIGIDRHSTFVGAERLNAQHDESSSWQPKSSMFVPPNAQKSRQLTGK